MLFRSDREAAPNAKNSSYHREIVILIHTDALTCEKTDCFSAKALQILYQPPRKFPVKKNKHLPPATYDPAKLLIGLQKQTLNGSPPTTNHALQSSCRIVPLKKASKVGIWYFSTNGVHCIYYRWSTQLTYLVS